MDKEFKKLTKQYAKDMLALIRSRSSEEKKRAVVEEEEVEEVEEEVAAAVVAPTATAVVVEPSGDWSCAGQLWLSPVVPCPSVGDKSKIKTGILHNGQRVTVCKECFLARERRKNQLKRDQKRAKINEVLN